MALRATVRRLGDLKPGVQPHLEIWSAAASILSRCLRPLLEVTDRPCSTRAVHPHAAAATPQRVRRWKKKPKDGVIDGMVTRTISPFELQPIRSLWDQYAPGNFLNNFPSLWDIGPGIVVLVGTVAWADWYFEVLGRHHRD